MPDEPERVYYIEPAQSHPDHNDDFPAREGQAAMQAERPEIDPFGVFGEAQRRYGDDAYFGVTGSGTIDVVLRCTLCSRQLKVYSGQLLTWDDRDRLTGARSAARLEGWNTNYELCPDHAHTHQSDLSENVRNRLGVSYRNQGTAEAMRRSRDLHPLAQRTFGIPSDDEEY
jgi:hypothetical protein